MARNGDSVRRVHIRITEHQPDVLKRIALLNTAFLRIATGGRLVEVERTDYEEGVMQFVLEDGRVRPGVEGAVDVSFFPLDQAAN